MINHSSKINSIINEVIVPMFFNTALRHLSQGGKLSSSICVVSSLSGGHNLLVLSWRDACFCFAMNFPLLCPWRSGTVAVLVGISCHLFSKEEKRN